MEKKRNVAIVTGASSGLGLEFARQIDARAAAGEDALDEIWLVARNAEKLDEIAGELRTPAFGVAADLSDPKDIASIAGALKDGDCNVAYLINCAGFGRFGSWEDISDSDAQTMIDLDARSVVMMTRACLPHMGRGSRVIQVASAAGFVPLPYMNLYSACKALVVRYTQGLRFELRGTGISVTALCPTWVKTGFEKEARKSSDGQAVKTLMFAQKPDIVVARALKANRDGRAVVTCSLPAFGLRMAGKLLPSSITMAAWNVIRKI